VNRQADDPGDVAHDLDDEVWRRLDTALSAVCRRDKEGFVSEVNTWPTELLLAGQQRSSMYLWFLLNYRIQEVLQRKPSPSDLNGLGLATLSKVRDILTNVNESKLEEVYRVVFEIAPLKSGLDNGEFSAVGLVALRVLLTEPTEQLAAMRREMTDWWGRNYRRFQKLGLVE